MVMWFEVMKVILEIFCMVAAAYNGANEFCLLKRYIIMSWCSAS